MIFDAFLGIVLSLVDTVLGLLPNWTAPDDGGLMTALSSVGNALGVFDGWINLTLLFGCIAIVVAAKLGLILAEFGVWVWGLLPGKAT